MLQRLNASMRQKLNMDRLRTKRPHILVIGDVMLDHYLWGKCERISPEAPVQVVDIQKESTVLGGAGNVVNNLLSLGAKVSVLSVVGNDENGKALLKMLQDLGADEQNIVIQEGRKTSKKSRVIASHQQVVRYDSESKEDITAVCEQELLAQCERNIANVDVVLLSDYGKGVITDAVAGGVIAAAKAASKKVLVDPKGKDYRKYRGAYLLTPNKKEASEATGILINDDKSLQKALLSLKETCLLECSMITLSEDGIAIYDKSMRRFPTVAKEVYDVTGAGDTVIASLSFALSCGYTIDEAAPFANHAAAVVVGYFINGMYGGYGAIISSLYPTEIRATANNFIMNIGRAVGGFSSVIIGFLLDKYSLMIVVVFLSFIYIFSLVMMLTIPGISKLKKSN